MADKTLSGLLDKFEKNPPMPASQFKFAIPKGADVFNQ